MKTALIIGASGLVGGHCLQQLLNDKYYDRVIALSRHSLGLEHVKLLNHVVDFDNQKQLAAVCAADHVFSAIGTTIKKAGSQENFYKVDFTYPYEVAKAAKANGAKVHILVSSLGADKKSPVFYSRTKGELEAAITTLDFEQNIILRPSLLLGKRSEKRVGEKIGQKLNSVFKIIMPKYQGVEAKMVAKTMIQFAKDDKKGIQIIENKAIIDFSRSRM